MRVMSPAKINLHLRVGPKRTDGFHPLQSWMVTVGLFDTLDFTLDTADGVSMSCSDPTLATDDSNLVIRAAHALQTQATDSERGETSRPTDMGGRTARIELQKAIPMGGGLGGGSSNAASTLVALNQLWELGLSRERLSEIASTLGSDVPFFLGGPSAICTGRGETIQKIDPPGAQWAVLLMPEISMPTVEVYRRFDQMPLPLDWNEAVDWSQWRRLDAEDLLRVLRNDLEPPAFAWRPELDDVRACAEKLVSRPVRLSGSGSTLFTLYDTCDCAREAESKIRRELSVRTMTVPIAVSEEVSG